MSEEQLKAFLDKVKGDTSLHEKFKTAKSADDVVSLASDLGYRFTADQLNQISEQELEGLAGGQACTPCTFDTGGGSVRAMN
ncbi:nif11-like leader peptide domain protein [Synechococcus sp. BIOS-E4-1]|uniref:Nif11-like leader peptide family natural product precursor n=1 Tax=Synechococcus sp. BIOS-E4-1 TaxID=1400864 RepID=UPI001647765A|nr:Nif11-like leader peptide family natural product precursor [Synechococcus sp. BIOS-E4-1]QNI54569.1 nif11-like leader peptide domain protein [Synechococcus sp. BIOS-E4-1]